jgi:hypothetical protein
MTLGVTAIRLFGKHPVSDARIEAMRRWFGELENELTRLMQR